jgi:hypothetical protein
MSDERNDILDEQSKPELRIVDVSDCRSICRFWLKAAIRCNLDEWPLSPKSALSQKLFKDQRQGLLSPI